MPARMVRTSSPTAYRYALVWSGWPLKISGEPVMPLEFRKKQCLVLHRSHDVDKRFGLTLVLVHVR
jgi:hypothetical protein